MKALLCLFCAYVKFEKYVYHLGVVPSPFVNLLKQVDGIDRLDKRGMREHHFQLVGLEMAEEMPLNISALPCICKFPNLLFQFLRTVISENALSGIVCFSDVVQGVIF